MKQNIRTYAELIKPVKSSVVYDSYKEYSHKMDQSVLLSLIL